MSKRKTLNSSHDEVNQSDVEHNNRPVEEVTTSKKPRVTVMNKGTSSQQRTAEPSVSPPFTPTKSRAGHTRSRTNRTVSGSDLSTEQRDEMYTHYEDDLIKNDSIRALTRPADSERELLAKRIAGEVAKDLEDRLTKAGSQDDFRQGVSFEDIQKWTTTKGTFAGSEKAMY
ncbi:hypothetical protein LPJ71_005086, partial [Coemansia sp. S17]